MRQVSWISVALILFFAHPAVGRDEKESDLDFDAIFATPQPEPPEGEIQISEGSGYRLARRAVPMHELVRGALPSLGFVLDSQGDLARTALRIRKGSTDEQVLLAAILAAAEAEPDDAAIERRKAQLATLRSRQGAGASRQLNRQWMIEDARRIGVVWGRLVIDLSPGSPVLLALGERIERRRVGIFSTESFEDPDHMVWRMERAFQAGIAAAASEVQP